MCVPSQKMWRGWKKCFFRISSLSSIDQATVLIEMAANGTTFHHLLLSSSLDEIVNDNNLLTTLERDCFEYRIRVSNNNIHIFLILLSSTILSFD